MTRPTAVRPVVLVTGASSGIGRATAELFARRGAAVVLCARSADQLAETAATCEAASGEVEVVVTDVAHADQVDAAVDRAVARFGRLDIVVNVAGITAYGSHTETSVDTFDQVVAVNLGGAANVARSSLRVFRSQRSGTLVIVGSLLGRVAVPLMGAYIASKWGVRGLARVLQQENRDLPGVHVTLVSPGSVRTEIYDRASATGGIGGSPPPPTTSPEHVAAEIAAAVRKPGRERDVDALGGGLNKTVSAAFSLAPRVFDASIGTLMRTFGTRGPRDDDALTTTERQAAR